MGNEGIRGDRDESRTVKTDRDPILNELLKESGLSESLDKEVATVLASRMRLQVNV